MNIMKECVHPTINVARFEIILLVRIGREDCCCWCSGLRLLAAAASGAPPLRIETSRRLNISHEDERDDGYYCGGIRILIEMAAPKRG